MHKQSTGRDSDSSVRIAKIEDGHHWLGQCCSEVCTQVSVLTKCWGFNSNDGNGVKQRGVCLIRSA